MAEPPLYVPAMKAKQGEARALDLLDAWVLDRIQPLLELVPGTGEDAVEVRDAVDRSVRRLGSLNGRVAFVDAGLLPTDDVLDDSRGALGYALRACHKNNITAVPVVGPTASGLDHADAARHHATTGNGIALRLTLDDIDEDLGSFDTRTAAVAQTAGCRVDELDLIIDLGYVGDASAARYAPRLAVDVISQMDDPAAYRTVVLLAGAFPADLSGVAAWELGEAPRRDAEVWTRVRRTSNLPRLPVFGDYCVSHPVLPVGSGFRAAPQLRYALADRWLLLKGRVNDPRGHNQFHEIADRVAGHPEFAGEALGKADHTIARSQQRGPGNASTWRALGTAHHIDLVTRRIAELGEP